MALQATPYKVELNLTDIDRNVYENLRFTVAKHPSETEERLCVRLIAYALWYHEQLAFGRGLSDVDEPALWEKSLDDRVLHWIEVGQPDSERITWCSRRTEKFSLVAYGNLRVWQGKCLDPVRSLKNINVVALGQEALADLAVKDTGLPLLRLYWYDAAPNRVPYPDQRELGRLTDVKLRLGNLRERDGGRRAQKGVDADLHADMTELARNKAAAK